MKKFINFIRIFRLIRSIFNSIISQEISPVPGTNTTPCRNTVIGSLVIHTRSLIQHMPYKSGTIHHCLSCNIVISVFPLTISIWVSCICSAISARNKRAIRTFWIRSPKIIIVIFMRMQPVIHVSPGRVRNYVFYPVSSTVIFLNGNPWMQFSFSHPQRLQFLHCLRYNTDSSFWHIKGKRLRNIGKIRRNFHTFFVINREHVQIIAIFYFQFCCYKFLRFNCFCLYRYVYMLRLDPDPLWLTFCFFLFILRFFLHCFFRVYLFFHSARFLFAPRL